MRKTAPLPFQGQKRYWVKETIEYVRQYLEAKEGEFSSFSPLIIFDVFGGSGLLAHNIKKTFGDLVDVHYFDWDNYTSRIARADQSNAQVQAVREYLESAGYNKNQKVSPQDKEVALWLMDAIQPDREQWDVMTLSGVTLFSGALHEDLDKYVRTGTFYHRAPQTTWDVSGYLAGVHVYQKMDFHDIMRIMPPGALLLLDPPYLYTDQNGYDKGNYFGLPETFDLLMLMKDAQEMGCDFVLYTSEKSGVHHVNRLNAKNIPDFSAMYLRERVMPSGRRGMTFNEQVYVSFLPRENQ